LSTNGVVVTNPSITNVVSGANVSNTAGVGFSGWALFGNVNSGGKKQIFSNGTVLLNGATAVSSVIASGYWNGGNDVINGVRFLFSSGNISTGKIIIYGVS
jgi:hypothetical protein